MRTDHRTWSAVLASVLVLGACAGPDGRLRAYSGPQLPQGETAIITPPGSPSFFGSTQRIVNVDGLEVTRRLKAMPEFASTRVLALLAHARDEDEARGLAAGCDGYVKKPIQLQDLFNALEKHLFTEDPIGGGEEQ